MLIEAYRHLKELCFQYNIKPRQATESIEYAMANDSEGEVFMLMPNKVEHYLGCLHEIGHCVDPVAMMTRNPDTWTREVAASRWAIKNALPHLVTEEGIDFLAECLHTYSQGLSKGLTLEQCRKELTR